MNDFTKNITVVNRSWRGVSETYFIYKNLSNYLVEIAENHIITLNKDGSYGYETAWDRNSNKKFKQS